MPAPSLDILDALEPPGVASGKGSRRLDVLSGSIGDPGGSVEVVEEGEDGMEETDARGG